jgi:hypothetical protein
VSQVLRAMTKRPTDPFCLWGKGPKFFSLFNWLSLMEIP